MRMRMTFVVFFSFFILFAHSVVGVVAGNAGYGHTLMRVDRHVNVTIVDRETATRAVNNPFFMDLRPINAETYELRMRKRCVSSHQPRQVGLMVYQLAKKELLSMYYDLIDRYIERSEYQLILCDTDSIYLSLSAPSLRACVRPALRPQFDREVRRWMPQYQCDYHFQERQKARDLGQDDEDDELEQRARAGTLPCCERVRKRERRTLGLWKVECECDGIIALAPKSYHCFDLGEPAEGEPAPDLGLAPGKTFVGIKTSSKGVQKINDLKAQDWYRVLDSKRPRYILNRGIKKDIDAQMKTYRQEKRGLSYLYTKRRVLRDGVSTRPLTL